MLLICHTLFGCGQDSGFEKLDSGRQVTRDGWWFSAGTVFLQPVVPGLLLGMQKPPDGPREIAYVILFRHDVRDNADVQRPDDVRVAFDGNRVSMTDGITINGKTVDLRLNMEVDQNSGQVNSETLKLDSKAYSTAQGRLFLVDLTVDPPTRKQVDAQFPTDLPKPHEKDAVRKLARTIMTELSRNNSTVSRFLMKRD